MFTVISPAKRLNLDPSELPLPATMPALSNDARILQKTAKNLSQKRIAELMKLKPDLAKLTSDRFKAMEFPLPDEDTLQAVLTFNGLAFIGLGARTLSAEDLTWAQDRLGILSGLFGILRPNQPGCRAASHHVRHVRDVPTTPPLHCSLSLTSLSISLSPAPSPHRRAAAAAARAVQPREEEAGEGPEEEVDILSVRCVSVQ